MIANHKAKLADEEFFILLRTAAGRDGKRYFAAFAPPQQRFHLFDENFNHLLSYPADALENRHAGLGDVELGDLDGDGMIKAYVGFAGTVGVKCVSLQGTRIWSCRNLFNVSRVLPGPADTQGHRELFCISDANSLAILDAKGQLRDAARLPGAGILQTLVHADLTGSGQETWCGVMFVPDPATDQRAIYGPGPEPQGRGDLEIRLALRARSRRSNRSSSGGSCPARRRNGSCRAATARSTCSAADGTLIDRFNYGEQVNGLATVEIDGKPVLLISSANGVEALRVE